MSDLARQLQGALEVGPDATFTVTFVPRLDDGNADLPPGATAP